MEEEIKTVWLDNLIYLLPDNTPIDVSINDHGIMFTANVVAKNLKTNDYGLRHILALDVKDGRIQIELDF